MNMPPGKWYGFKIIIAKLFSMPVLKVFPVNQFVFMLLLSSPVNFVFAFSEY